ncbi:myosin IC heavy chain-like [Equus quagga]|uniref:myosin IC heavy chain-like n=1 Tax=Equus quagga TaxID=89248 RepID=UPI001EE29645|nr:myosin IC heavy chain-like [Equus quagga]XP_046517194.1 myosin IC heavy chain-like [Equus quagga]XP_046517195.1 myosin IC heavy chain-like [Equus quagga]XP_046517196.1 myosin IC heavy chain-like [Equus quagga]XP_046517197.1 myosin IC heavy chain-like [Equus quagga]
MRPGGPAAPSDGSSSQPGRQRAGAEIPGLPHPGLRRREKTERALGAPPPGRVRRLPRASGAGPGGAGASTPRGGGPCARAGPPRGHTRFPAAGLASLGAETLARGPAEPRPGRGRRCPPGGLSALAKRQAKSERRSDSEREPRLCRTLAAARLEDEPAAGLWETPTACTPV